MIWRFSRTTLTFARKGSLRLWPVSGRLGQDVLSGAVEDQGAHAGLYGMLNLPRMRTGCFCL